MLVGLQEFLFTLSSHSQPYRYGTKTFNTANEVYVFPYIVFVTTLPIFLAGALKLNRTNKDNSRRKLLKN